MRYICPKETYKPEKLFLSNHFFSNHNKNPQSNLSFSYYGYLNFPVLITIIELK